MEVLKSRVVEGLCRMLFSEPMKRASTGALDQLSVWVVKK